MRWFVCSQYRRRVALATMRVLLAGLCLGSSVALYACSVDDRTLLSGSANAGALGTGGASGTSGAPSADGGDPGQALDLPRCVYLSATVASDCETLVQNAGFGVNIADWAAEPVGMTVGWLQTDAMGDSHSGSLVVTNLNYKEDVEAASGSNGGAARQCVPVTAGQTYDLAADVFVPIGQGAGFEGTYTSNARLSVFFYAGNDCSGQNLSNFTSTPVEQTDEWVHIEGTTKAPKESAWMAVRLATLKPFRQLRFEAHFDNVFVRERAQ